MNPTQKVITDTNKSPLVQVLTLMFLVIALLACSVRTGTKIRMIKILRADDILTIVASVLAIGQSIAMFIGCNNGLGQHFNTLNSREIDTFFKSQYAANTMFIASLFCCKLSGIVGLRIMSRESQKYIIFGCEAVVGGWGFTALVVNIFQCRLPTPWRYADDKDCIDRTAFWTYYSITNIASDIAIVVIMCESVLKIQTSWSKKALVLGVFGSRILVTPAIAAQIYYSNKAFGATDFTFSIWKAAIALQLVQCLSILTVCIPSFKPFLDSVESGQIRVDDLRRQGKTSTNGYPSGRPGYSGNKSSRSTTLGTGSRPFRLIEEPVTTESQHSQVFELADFSKSNSQGAVKMTTEQQGAAPEGQSRRRSHSSQSILIHQTWQVEVRSTHERALGED
ncbi:hypothetical protein B0J15DRAFT_456835 [Fusarium solani]|uniref:Rhodopsin domain-containing protein n=1 Tax=Fusarium solani TaxID=169388 RepID=A0A9P9G196_FUSSL|nr:uncharacterized protein B0J15DRAFT_456835 [Fusarium solani]KAH7224438.1 hypothetical protein B0J15DRAFT_456835 [Fusarium solani]